MRTGDISRVDNSTKNNGPTHIGQPALIEKYLMTEEMEDCNAKPSPLPKNTQLQPTPTSTSLNPKKGIIPLAYRRPPLLSI